MSTHHQTEAERRYPPRDGGHRQGPQDSAVFGRARRAVAGGRKFRVGGQTLPGAAIVASAVVANAVVAGVVRAAPLPATPKPKP
jgi:hypothetical protein